MTARSDAEQQACVDEEKELLSHFVNLLIQDDAIWDEMPPGAMVFLYREGDREGEAKNRRAAEKVARKGRPVYVRGIPPAAPLQR